jgi:hypothetical protein
MRASTPGIRAASHSPWLTGTKRSDRLERESPILREGELVVSPAVRSGLERGLSRSEEVLGEPACESGPIDR